MRIMVTGSRRWTDAEVIRQVALSWIIRAGNEPLTVIHGGAAGADTLADRAFRFVNYEMLPILFRTRPVDLTIEVMRPKYIKGATIWNKRAPLERNLDMLDTNPDVVLAFLLGQPEHGGTRHAVGHAQARGIPVWVINHPDPDVQDAVQADDGDAAGPRQA